MALNTTELRQQRAKIVDEMRKLHEGTIERGVETAEEKEKFEKMEQDCRALERVIEKEDALLKLEGDNARSLLDKPNANGADPAKKWDGIHYPTLGGHTPTRSELERRVSYAVQGWLRCGKLNPVLETDHIEAAKFFKIDLRQKEIELPISKHYRTIQKEYRDLNVAAGTKGQETIPEGFVNALEVALLTFGGMRQVSDVIRTDSGNDLPWPTVNDTTNMGELLGEASNFGASVDPSFGQVVFKAFKYSSKPILVSSELLQDSAFDLGARIGEMLGIRIGRIQNLHFTTGAGTTLPKGVTVAATLGLEASGATIEADDLINLEHSVDPAYRTGARFMMHDKILAKVRLLKFQIGADTVSWVWQPGLQSGVPDRLLGYPYTINQQMEDTETGNAALVLFGDFMKYKIRDVATLRLVRLDELYAATDQVGFVAYMRSDGNLLDAGTNPIKYLQITGS